MTQPARGRYRVTLSAACLLLLSCSEALTTSDSDVDRIVVDPASVSLVAGETRPTTAQVFDADGQRIVDRAVYWSSQNAGVATVSQSGVIAAVGSGNTQVAASAGGKSGLVTVSVTDRPVTLVRVVPSTASVQAGLTVSLAADALDASGAEVPGRPVRWETNRNNVATVSTGGVVTGVAPGTATITATVDGIAGSGTITVSAVPAASVTVTPATGTVVQGGALQLSATVRDAQGNTLTGRAVTWSSSEESIATVSSTGRVVGVAEGSFTITATSGGISDTGAYSVTRIPVGLVRLSPAAATIAVGQTQPLTVSLFAADKTTPLSLAGRTIAWSSSSTSAATVSSSGVVSGISPGSATITATVEGISGAASVSVTSAPIASITVAPTSASVEEGKTTTLTATALDAKGNVLAGRTFFWTSSNASQLSVSQSGVVTAAVGSANASATITASAPGGGAGGSILSGSSTVNATYAPVSSVTVTPNSATVHVGSLYARQFTAVAKDASGGILGGRTFVWTSDPLATATVNPSTGVVAGVATGPVTVTATTGSVSGSAAVTVDLVAVHRVVVTPSSTTLDLATNQTKALTASPRDSANNPITGAALGGRGITWHSSDAAVAGVSSSGVVTPTGVGTATITATIDGTDGTSAITVTPSATNPLPLIATVRIAPAALHVGPNRSRSVTVQVRLNGGVAARGRACSLTSADATIATVSPPNGITGQNGDMAASVKGAHPGATDVNATCEGIVGTTKVSVP